MPYKYRHLENHSTAQDKPKRSSKPDPKRPASHQRQLAQNKANHEKLTKLGGVAGMIGITRAYPKKPSESEFEYIKRGFMESPGGVNDIKKVVKKVVKKVRG